MKRLNNTWTVWVAVAATGALLSACDTVSDGGLEGAKSDPPSVIGQAGDVVKDAGQAVGDTVLNGGSAAGAALETADVKLALSADSRVDAAGINVDTDHLSKTVTLKGHVPTDGQKVFAGEIAVKRAVGYRVDNQLRVGIQP